MGYESIDTWDGIIVSRNLSGFEIQLVSYAVQMRDVKPEANRPARFADGMCRRKTPEASRGA